jgi:hypothetical protein
MVTHHSITDHLEPTMTIFDPQAMLVSRYVSLRKKSK